MTFAAASFCFGVWCSPENLQIQGFPGIQSCTSKVYPIFDPIAMGGLSLLPISIATHELVLCTKPAIQGVPNIYIYVLYIYINLYVQMYGHGWRWGNPMTIPQLAWGKSRGSLLFFSWHVAQFKPCQHKSRRRCFIYQYYHIKSQQPSQQYPMKSH